MKKTTIMRIASTLLIAVLLTTCAIGATFAKYTINANANDNARVAKWGVTASVTGAAFATSYGIQDEGTDVGEVTLAVESSTEDKLVAPGTEGTFTGVALTGTPEVAVRITKVATVTLNGWTVDEAFYCPIVITINGEEISGLAFNTAAEFIAAIEAAIENGTGVYAPNTNLAGIANMNGNYAWEWAFTGDDAKDTKLGDLEAQGTNVNTIAIAVAVTVDQVD